MKSRDHANRDRFIPLPEPFVRWANEKGLTELLEALDRPESMPVSVRLNPDKKSECNLLFKKPVPWAQEGEAYYLSERPVFTADPVFHGGAYYVQEAGSMYVGSLLRELDIPLNRVLDLCAAPGGKTTHVASVVREKTAGTGFVVANEVIRARAKTLAENVQKWGTGNVVVTSNDPAEFGERLEGFFDVVVVDAPCSGEGMFRKDAEARREWSPESVQLCAARQRRIVSDVWTALKEGGVMIYSTCTFNEQENEENVRWIADALGGELLQEKHFYPGQSESEGFYAAVIRKAGEYREGYAEFRSRKGGEKMPLPNRDERLEAERWLSGGGYEFGVGRDGMLYAYRPELFRVMAALLERLYVLYSGIQVGEMIRGVLKPSHPLALTCELNRTVVPVAEVDDAAAMEYLRKGSSPELLPVSLFSEGLNLVVCRGIALGWIKRIGNRYNNLYPQNRRVLHY